MNGRDFTNDKVSYGFYDAFVLDVQPKLISKKGGTDITVRGFGFVDSGSDEIAAKFGSKMSTTLTCGGNTPCVTPATFVDKNTIKTRGLPQSSVSYPDGQNIAEDPMTVDVSVYGSSFTDNGIEVYYIYQPEYKSLNRDSVPRNLQVPLLIETDFHWQNNDYELFAKHSNFTCRFTVGNRTVVTLGRMEKMPLGASYSSNGEEGPLPDYVVCPSPKVPSAGKGKLEISANGVDYEGNGFSFEFED